MSQPGDDNNDVHSIVRDYYGKVLSSNRDLKTTACCAAETPDESTKKIIAQLHPAVTERFYGCGCPIPPLLEGLTVLDLGSGSGRDAFILSSLVGPSGKVIGVDMTEEQVALANSNVEYHMEQFRFSRPNVEFRHGYIEDLGAAGIENNSVDLIISNCVINLSPEKDLIFSEIFRVLKPGGELFYSDVLADRRIPSELMNDSELVGECLAGAIYREDLRRYFQKAGCLDHRTVSSCPLKMSDSKISEKIGPVNFISATIRAFKLEFEDRCENYGQIARYLGGIPQSSSFFRLDHHHLFESDLPLPVCGNTASMLQESRYRNYFEVIGSRKKHLGMFPCAGSDGLGRSTLKMKDGTCC